MNADWNQIWEQYKAIIIAVIVGLLLLLSTIFVVPEEEQVVVVRAGEPISIVNRFRADQPFGETGAGVAFRIPLLDSLVHIDKRVLDLDMSQQQVLSSDQQRLLVDAYARFRIIDPVQMVESAGSTRRRAVAARTDPQFRPAAGTGPAHFRLDADRRTRQCDDQHHAQARCAGAALRGADPRRADQADRSARRRAAGRRLHPDAYRSRTGSPRHPRAGVRAMPVSSGPKPMPTPPVSMPKVSARMRNSTISTAPCKATTKPLPSAKARGTATSSCRPTMNICGQFRGRR